MKKLLCLVITLTVTVSVHAETRGFQLSVTPDLALQSTDTTIHGLSLNLLCGQNELHGVDFGLVNIMSKSSSGFGFGLINVSDSFCGVQWGVINVDQDGFSGWQEGLFNYSGGTASGLQSGLVNVAHEFSGLQLGIFNYANELQGFQIGLINIATANPWFTDFPSRVTPLWPILNWSF